MRRRGHNHWPSRHGSHEDGPYARTVRDIARNLLVRTKLGNLSRKNVERLEGVTLVEELLLPFHKRSGKKGKAPWEERLEGAALSKALRKFLAQKGKPKAPRAPGKPAKKNLANLARLLGLKPEERQVLTFVLALEQSEKLQELTDLYGDISPTAAIRVIAAGMHLGAETIFRCLGPSGRLVTSGMVSATGNSYLQYVFDTHSGVLDLVSTPGLSPKELVARLLRESRSPGLSWSDFEHLQPAADLARDLLRGAVQQRHRGLNILLYGPTGTGKSELARGLAEEAGVQAYSAGHSGQGAPPSPEERISSLLLGQRLLARDRAVLIFDELEDLFSWSWEGMAGDRARGVAHMSKQWFNALLETCSVPTIWISNATSGVDPAFLRRFTYAVEVGPLDARQRARVLRRHLDPATLDDHKVESLARQYPVSPGQLATAARAATLFGQQGRDDFADSIHKLLEPIQTLLGGRSSSKEADLDLGAYRLDILNADVDLGMVADRLTGWQPGAGPGVSLCLYGLPGTGKSELVRYLAHRAGRPLHRHPASDLLSMWVGGTEKRISAAFRDAEKEGAVLLFDEADSFLRDRRKAFHRWEVSQVNEFLQQLEVFKGIVACTTNLREELDMASLRRFVFKIELRPLRTEQARVLFEHTLRRLGAEAQPDRDDELSRLDRLDTLTPGDFAAVARRLSALGQDVDAATLLGNLEQELMVKETKPRSIGFSGSNQPARICEMTDSKGGNG